MLKKLLAIFALFTAMSTQAGVVTWSNFDLVWNGTGTKGGVVTILSQEGLGSFEAVVSDFSESYYWNKEGAPPPVDTFLSYKEGSDVEFSPWLMFIDTVQFPGLWIASSIGTGYDQNPMSPFTVTEFREAYWQIDDNRAPVTSVPEPGTYLLLLLGLTSLIVVSKKKAALPQKVRYTS